jgi:uncharacterized OB-fold protein
MSGATAGVTVAQCCRCGARYFPRRLVCRRCGSSAFTDERLHEAVVEETTVVMHVAGGARREPRTLATVRAADGLHLIVGLAAPLPEGTRVLLSEQDGAPLARPADGG